MSAEGEAAKPYLRPDTGEKQPSPCVDQLRQLAQPAPLYWVINEPQPIPTLNSSHTAAQPARNGGLRRRDVRPLARECSRTKADCRHTEAISRQRAVVRQPLTEATSTASYRAPGGNGQCADYDLQLVSSDGKKVTEHEAINWMTDPKTVDKG
ncbi:unnamed protein product [Vitrella brassicaformis CCMP3155]|uniref:Uncharacterized protein n=1 Tax=Vitrella brassicaformis (strain CCMP3155) TaxID=1169540 RepID=A0A0G4GG75_VITBC|nr:unnamed protein product [Vitrella brassicaformis CCMP3155]|eukprot:CEM28616.1 unnamed protein product [Vitrella brassicaformis CCMP3155]